MTSPRYTLRLPRLALGLARNINSASSNAKLSHTSATTGGNLNDTIANHSRNAASATAATAADTSTTDQLPVRELRGVIFDLDGTLVPLLIDFHVIREAISCPEGKDIATFIEGLADADERARAWEVVIAEETRGRDSGIDPETGEVQTLPGFHTLMRVLDARGVRRAVVTRNTRDAVSALARGARAKMMSQLLSSAMSSSPEFSTNTREVVTAEKTNGRSSRSLADLLGAFPGCRRGIGVDACDCIACSDALQHGIDPATYEHEHFGFIPVLGREFQPQKPSPDPGHAVLAHSLWGFAPEEVLFVGDSTDDLLCGRACGMATALLTTHERHGDYVHLADVAVSSLDELASKLEHGFVIEPKQT